MRREHGETDLLRLRQWPTAAAGATLSGAVALSLASPFFTDDNQRGGALHIPTDYSVPWPAGNSREKQ
ncbi:hypothetical protein [Nocardioides daeguensis]|uniref:Uncharacterized protein n=1 Tax=Nocardioides daeguensis TaxID=908359 RepID=A0ABP6WML0_9ACTN|nr:hypothetical protein [Nocardioides daeguensis]MBV6729075.1 hypothetical protein [Nocardioides daeguensis]MCR1774921.1 hypothetical protein [Nocardioides daeguensis]